MSKGKLISEQESNRRIKRLFSGGFFTEGPSVDSKGLVYFTDLTFTVETGNEAGIIYRYSPEYDTTIIYRSPSGMANGLFILNDTLYAAEGADKGGRRISKTDLTSGRSRIVTDLFAGLHLNSPNDIVVAKSGEIYFTDPRYIGSEKIEQPVNGVYRINSDNSVELLIENISQPNGIALTFDGKYLFVGCLDESVDTNVYSPVMKGRFIARYKLLNNKAVFDRIVVEYSSESGPDGMLISDDRMLFVALRNESSPAVVKYDFEGTEVERIYLPEVPSNVSLGTGKYKDILYITAGGSLYSTEIE
ncbi:MAG: SMP-30/gluconolactonase/LRE family protein [Melioribacteraceae bacterium]|nr:SMP-30/gluconolactonase/LRE family protein [Melioribacteraceae bacterium]